jgi:hypothetical protein
MEINNIPKIFQAIMGLIFVVSLVIFIINIDFTDTDKADDNIAEVTTMAVDSSITGIMWMSKAVDTISNPYIMLLVIGVIGWLFGYFK